MKRLSTAVVPAQVGVRLTRCGGGADEGRLVLVDPLVGHKAALVGEQHLADTAGFLWSCERRKTT